MPATNPTPDPALERMVRLVARSVHDRRVLDALRAVPRHEFVPAASRRLAYADEALPTGEGQTISQPTVVGVMTEALALAGTEHVLEVGTGSGYQAAVLARLARDVVSVEIIDALRERARDTLARLGVTNVRVLAAGPQIGAPHLAPFDAIIVTAAAPEVPAPLLAQLRIGGRLVIPVGTYEAQELYLVTRQATRVRRRALGAVRFVPLRGPGGFTPRFEPPLDIADGHEAPPSQRTQTF